MIELGYDFERRINDMLRNTIAANSIKPITLGGVDGPDGGTGVPIGGFIGKLVQSLVAYDTTEAAIDTPSPLPSGVSLVTNLNKIRYDISQIDSRVTVLEETSYVTSFLELSDTPASFSGHAYEVVAVNGSETALEFKEVITEKSFTWFFGGELASGVHPAVIENLFDFSLSIKKIKGYVGTYPQGSGISVDVLINDASILGGSYYYIPENSNGSLLNEPSGFSQFTPTDTLKVTIIEVGTNSAGENLTLQVVGELI